MRELALFAGAGGGLLATTHLLGWRTVAAVEIDPYRREVLLRRQRDGLLDLFPIWDDIRTFNGEDFRDCIDVVTAGFPCQPFSVAGKRRAGDDERNFWPDTIRVVREVRPRCAFLENVPGLLTSGYFGRILGDLAEVGYDAEWCVLGADDAGAPHQRKRLWLFASNSDCKRGRKKQECVEWGKDKTIAWDDGEKKYVANSIGVWKLQSEGGKQNEWRRSCDGSNEMAHSPKTGFNKKNEYQKRSPSRCGWWSTEPDVGRVADGVANRVDRIESLGDGQVPAVVALAWEILSNRKERE